MNKHQEHASEAKVVFFSRTIPKNSVDPHNKHMAWVTTDSFKYPCKFKAFLQHLLQKLYYIGLKKREWINKLVHKKKRKISMHSE